MNTDNITVEFNSPSQSIGREMLIWSRVKWSRKKSKMFRIRVLIDRKFRNASRKLSSSSRVNLVAKLRFRFCTGMCFFAAQLDVDYEILGHLFAA